MNLVRDWSATQHPWCLAALAPFLITFRTTMSAFPHGWQVAVWLPRAVHYPAPERLHLAGRDQNLLLMTGLGPAAGFASLAQAQEAVVSWWLDNRLTAVCRWVEHQPGISDVRTFEQLRQAIDPLAGAAGRSPRDELAPGAFRDFLEEQGLVHVFDSWIVEPGNEAGIHWPRGWEFALSLSRVDSCPETPF